MRTPGTGRGDQRPNFRSEAKRGQSREARRKSAGGDPSSLYPADWAEISAAVRRRDGFRCQVAKLMPDTSCGAYFPPPFHGNLHVHHIVPLDVSGTAASNAHLNRKSNLITLCTLHHGAVHGRTLGKAASRKVKAAIKDRKPGKGRRAYPKESFF